MITYSVNVPIDRPVEQVFAYLTDAANHPKWDSSSVVMEPQEPGAWHTCSTFREVRRIGPRTLETRSQVEHLEPNRSFDMKSLSGPPFHGHWRF